MLQNSATTCVPKAGAFGTSNFGGLTQTQVRPNGFRVNYHADGTGRDTFVGTDNGGFYAAFSPCSQPQVTSFVAKRRYEKPSPVIKSRGVQYHSDGSGRDSYIGFNAGGLTAYGSKTVHSLGHFTRSLRGTNRTQSAYKKSGGFKTGMTKTSSVTLLPPREGDPSRREDILTSSQMTFSRKFEESQRKLHSYQKSLDDRLSAPKRVRGDLICKVRPSSIYQMN